MLADGVRVGGLQIPRGNAKSTLWAAVALWALCDDPDAPQVPLVGFNGLQVQTTLWRPIQRMVALSPSWTSRVRVFKSSAIGGRCARGTAASCCRCRHTSTGCRV